MPLTGLGLYNGYRGDAWLINRIRVLRTFVVNSLSNQTNQHFYLWISVRPEDKENPIIHQLKNNLDKIRDLSFFVTYGGLCFYDDKLKNGNEVLLNNLKATLPELEERVKEFKEVLVTIQPSDDMYLSRSVDQIQNTEFEKVAGYRQGYIINYASKEVAEYNPETCPPFYTIKFPKEVFINAKQHFEYVKDYVSHEYVEKDMTILPGRGFVVGTHGANISTTWNIPFKGRLLNKEEKDKVLLETGNYFTDPVLMKPTKTVRLRKLLNILPFQKQLKVLYYKLIA